MSKKIETASQTAYTSFDAAFEAWEKLERRAKCPSAKKRTVFRVVRLTAKERKATFGDSFGSVVYIVCATPWAYRLQQQGRGKVVPMSDMVGEAA